MANQSNGLGFGFGLTVGSILGLGAYYLYATKEGSRLRKDFVEEYEKAKTQFALHTVLPPESQKVSPDAEKKFRQLLKSLDHQKTSLQDILTPYQSPISTQPGLARIKNTVTKFIELSPTPTPKQTIIDKSSKPRLFSRKKKS
jgi:gas vesicle protein